jgi:hypothetical protein
LAECGLAATYGGSRIERVYGKTPQKGVAEMLAKRIFDVQFHVRENG